MNVYIFGKENNMKEQGQEKNGIILKKQHIISIVLMIAAIVFFFILGLMMNNCSGAKTNETMAEDSVEVSFDIDPEASDPYKAESSVPKPKGIRIPGYPEIEIPAGETKVSADFINPEGNPCYFKFELVLEESGETLYESGLVPPGKSIHEITLSRPLEKGDYPAVIKITTASLDTNSPMNGANNRTVLSVK